VGRDRGAAEMKRKDFEDAEAALRKSALVSRQVAASLRAAANEVQRTAKQGYGPETRVELLQVARQMETLAEYIENPQPGRLN
jgi:hypothetical protein